MSNNKLIPLVYKGSIYNVIETRNLNAKNKKFLRSTHLSEPPKFTKQKYTVKEYNPILVLGDKTLMPRFLPYADTDKWQIVSNPKLSACALKDWPKSLFLADIAPEKNQLIANVITQLDTIGGCTLKLGTGKGKSRIATKIVHYFGQNTVIVVLNKDLQSQIYKEVVDNLGPNIKVVFIGGRAKKLAKYTFDEQTIFIAVVNSAKKLTPDFWSNIYLTIFDECHCYCNDTGMAVMMVCNTPRVLAMSATPFDSWKSNMALYWCGPLYDGDVLIPEKKLEGTVKVINYYGNEIYTETQRNANGVPSPCKMVKLLAEDAVRNELLVTEIVELVKQKYTVLAFALCNIMLEKISALVEARLALLDLPHKPTVGVLIGARNEEERELIKSTCSVIFTNYKFGKVGLNVARTNAIILLSPYKTGANQLDGRMLRTDDSILRWLIDIVDRNTFLAKQYNTRKLDYIFRNFKILMVDN